jgi:hypothetical protein
VGAAEKPELVPPPALTSRMLPGRKGVALLEPPKLGALRALTTPLPVSAMKRVAPSELKDTAQGLFRAALAPTVASTKPAEEPATVAMRPEPARSAALILLLPVSAM